MSLPNLLLVDDSDAILAFERATLLGHFTTTFAHNGEEALASARQLRPAAILLDLSMPVMDGEQVLAHLQADPELARIPVIIVSSERERAEACLASGAKAFVPKPIRADELRATIGRVLAEARAHARGDSLAVLFVDVGGTQLGFPLAAVDAVLDLPLTTPIVGGPPFLCEMFELRGRPIALLDMARRLDLVHTARLVDRKVLVLHVGEAIIGATVDGVFDPEEIPRSLVVSAEELGIAQHPPLSELVDAIVRNSRGLVPLLRADALLSPELLSRLALLVRAAPFSVAGP